MSFKTRGKQVVGAGLRPTAHLMEQEGRWGGRSKHSEMMNRWEDGETIS